jgi:membrane protease YdiL (CAAX protease family)
MKSSVSLATVVWPSQEVFMMSHLIDVTTTVLIFFVGWIGVWLAIAFPLFKKYEWRPFRPTTPEKKLLLLLPLYGIAPLGIWIANQVLGQSWAAIGVVLAPASGRSLGLGFGMAAAGLFLLLLLKHQLRFVTVADVPSLTASGPALKQSLATIAGLFLLALVIGGIEELVFRGWLQTQLELALAPWLAATLGSVIFAIAHLVWDGRAGLWQQPGLLLLGWVLVIARWADGGNLALAWGLHAGWVWGLACIGELMPTQPVDEKPVWLTGRSGQPLTDVLDMGLMVLTAGLIWQLWTLRV